MFALDHFFSDEINGIFPFLSKTVYTNDMAFNQFFFGKLKTTIREQ